MRFNSKRIFLKCWFTHRQFDLGLLIKQDLSQTMDGRIVLSVSEKNNKLKRLRFRPDADGVTRAFNTDNNNYTK